MRADEVYEFLKEHPDFFNDYPDLVDGLTIMHPQSGRMVSLVERQMVSLREKKNRLTDKLEELIQFGQENDVISEKMHRLSVSMIAAVTMQSVLHLLEFHLKEDFNIPNVALRLWQQPSDSVALPEYAEVAEELQVFAESLSQPYCGSTDGFGTAAWFGEVEKDIRAQALIALRTGGGTFGMVALGSTDPNRFYAGMGTLYLERLGELISAVIARTNRITG